MKPSNKTKLYKYTSCVSREGKRLLGLSWSSDRRIRWAKNKTEPVKSFTHWGAAVIYIKHWLSIVYIGT